MLIYVLFFNGSTQNVDVLKELFFSHYELISGQKINWHKSSMCFSKEISKEMISNIHSSNGMQQGSFPFIYLGVLLFFGCPKVSHFKPVKDKILTHLSAWQCRHLSMVCRVFLIIFLSLQCSSMFL